jgi:RsiW-degrading membrane proteinase PrsW (M82 family)
VHLFLEASIALTPVLAFFGALLYLDSYDLVSFREVAFTMTMGVVLCLAALEANGYAIDFLDLDFSSYSHYGAPVIEETLKALALAYLFTRNRIGFLIDAAIMGFSVGTGFALVENAYLIQAFPQASIGVWIIRGFGTAMMHGSATALFAMISQWLIEHRLRPILFTYVPALAAAIALHTGFNLLGASPLAATSVLLIAFPVGLILVFSTSEHAVHQWLLSDYESHQHFLDQIKSGAFTEHEAMRVMGSLAAKLSPERLADIFAYMQIHTELVLRAEKLSLARENGEKLPITPEDETRFHRMHQLERRIGRTSLMAIRRHLHFSRRELWELNELKGELWRVHPVI